MVVIQRKSERMYFQFGSRIYGERRGKRKRRRITSEEKYT
jgi:hypothetical protein